MNEDDKPWIAIYDQWGDVEGHISGNKEGLLELKNKIDQALNEGRAPMEDFDCDFNSVALRETRDEKVKSDSYTDRAIQVGCLFLVALLIIISLLGIWKVSELLGF